MNRRPAIFLALGANLPSRRHGGPLATCRAALRALEARGVRIESRSRWYRSAPVPVSRQPAYVNGVVRVSTRAGPRALLATLHEIEAAFGRRRTVAGAPRVLDLDLLAYGDRITGAASGLVLPHPRLHERAFVLKPLAELAPGWVHPRLGLSVERMLAELPPDQSATPFAAA